MNPDFIKQRLAMQKTYLEGVLRTSSLYGDARLGWHYVMGV